MSIVLDVKPYCENCPDFEVKVDKFEHESYDMYSVKSECETSIRCKFAKRCEAIKRYLEQKAIEKDGVMFADNLERSDKE